MQAKHIGLLAVTASISVSCGNAQAATFNASNPVHCAAALAYFELVAQNMGDQNSATGLKVRAQWYGGQAKNLPQEQRSYDVLQKIGADLDADPEAAAVFAGDCQERQNQHPDWQAKMNCANEQIALGNGNMKVSNTPCASVSR